MFELYKARRRAAIAQANRAAARSEAEGQLIRRAVRLGARDFESTGITLFKASINGVSSEDILTSTEGKTYDIHDLIKYSRRNSVYHPLAYGLLEIILLMALGHEGATIKAPNKQMQAIWDDMWKYRTAAGVKITCGWSRQREMLRRLIRDGNRFMQLLWDKGKMTFNDVSPLQVAEVVHTSNGIRYHVLEPGKLTATVYKEEDILHLKAPNVDEVQPWALPYFTSMLKVLAQVEDFFDSWIELGIGRSKILFLHKILQGGLAAVEDSVTDRQVETDTTDTQTGTGKHVKLESGSIVTCTEGEDYDIKAPNIQATDTMKIIRESKLMMSGASCLAEHLVGGDAGNQNYASITEATSPSMWANETIRRGYLSEPINAMYIVAINKAFQFMGFERMQATDDNWPGEPEMVDVLETPPMIDFPELAFRDIDAKVKGVVSLIQEGLISRRTAIQAAGYDPDQELELIEQERGEDLERAVRDQDQNEDEMESLHRLIHKAGVILNAD